MPARAKPIRPPVAAAVKINRNSSRPIRRQQDKIEMAARKTDNKTAMPIARPRAMRRAVHNKLRPQIPGRMAIMVPPIRTARAQTKDQRGVTARGREHFKICLHRAMRAETEGPGGMAVH